MVLTSNFLWLSILLASGNDLPCQYQRDCLIQNSPNKIIMVQLSNSQSTDAPVTLCDRSAAFPFDPAKKTPGVSYSQLDAASAISQCQIAVKDFPQTSRLYFQLGRGLEKGRRLPEAISAYQTAANLGHGGGFNNLGELYRDGKGVSKDLKMAEVYFRKGSDINYAEAQYNLAILLLKNKNSDSNTALARDLLSAALLSGYSDAKKPLDMLPPQQPQLALGGRPTVTENSTVVEGDTAISNARPDDYEVDSVVTDDAQKRSELQSKNYADPDLSHIAFCWAFLNVAKNADDLSKLDKNNRLYVMDNLDRFSKEVQPVLQNFTACASSQNASRETYNSCKIRLGDRGKVFEGFERGLAIQAGNNSTAKTVASVSCISEDSVLRLSK